MADKTFILTLVGLGQAKEIFRGTIRLVQMKKKQLKSQPQYKNYDLQVRTPEGFKAVPILPKKLTKKK